MRANELIMEMRYRLRDEAKEGWSDEELLSSINLSLSAIARKLNLWKSRWVTSTIPYIDTYSIPEDFVSPISLVVGSEMIEIKGIEWALSHSGDTPCAFIDNDALILYPVPQEEIPILFNYKSLRRLNSVGDVVPLGDEYIDTALFYALSLAYQKQSSEESLTQSRYFLNLFKDQVADVRNASSQRQNGRTIKSRHQKV